MAKLRQGRRSDAILSCPGCLTSVCLDCQQHAERDSHFRAMFVSNCRREWSHECLCHRSALSSGGLGILGWLALRSM